MKAAREHRAVVSYDLNYRDSLWRSNGGQPRAREVNRKLMPYVDVLFGNEEDFSAALGFSVEGVDVHYTELPIESFKRMLSRVLKEFPNVTTVGTTLRAAHNASVNGWGALCYHEGEYYVAPPQDVHILDRVGGGDSFASGFIYGLLSERDAEWALRCGQAHGALAMSTPGDTSMALKHEVMAAMEGRGARISR
jgi:2-dehydro-3-deoxygluconokinase